MIELLAIFAALAAPAERHDVPPALVRSIVFEESRGSDAAISRGAYARGQMQVRFSSVCRGCRNKSFVAPLLHVRAINHFHGTRILSKWLRHAKRRGLKGRDCWIAALAGYNGGWRGFRKGAPAGRPLYYAKRVLRRARL